MRPPVEFDPLLAVGETDGFSEWGARIGRVIAPIGELDRGSLKRLLVAVEPRRPPGPR